jgi:hypothetical protein
MTRNGTINFQERGLRVFGYGENRTLICTLSLRPLFLTEKLGENAAFKAAKLLLSTTCETFLARAVSLPAN